ncbi:hypothetical protein Tco_1150187 [Tanacetum coccineum]
MLLKLSECKRFVNFLHGEVRHAIMNIDHLNGLIEMMEVMKFTLEIYDSVWRLREMVKAENKKLLGLNKHLVDAEEDIKAKERYLEILEEAIYSHDMPIIDEVVFKIHKKGVFEFDPLRYVNGVVYSVSAFTCDRDIFPTCLDWILSKISEEKWALFYCLPNKQLEHGLKLIHTDNDVHSFFADAELNGKIHLYIAHKQQPLQRYELPESTLPRDDTLRCSSSTPISSKLKRNSNKKIKEGLRKKGKAIGITLIDSCDKGKEKVDEFPTPTKEHQVVVTNYKRAIVNGKAKMVEVVAPVQENVDVGIKQEDRRRKNVLGSMAPANFVKNPVVSASMGQGSSVKVC